MPSPYAPAGTINKENDDDARIFSFALKLNMVGVLLPLDTGSSIWALNASVG